MLFFFRKTLTKIIRQKMLALHEMNKYPLELQELIVEKCFQIVAEILLMMPLKPKQEIYFSIKMAQEICDLLEMSYQKRGNTNPISFRIAITAKHIKKVCLSNDLQLQSIPFKKLNTYTILYELPITRLEIATVLHQKLVSFSMKHLISEPKFRSFIERYIHETFMIYGRQNKKNWIIFIETLIQGIFEKMALRGNGYYFVELSSEKGIPSLVLRKALVNAHFSNTGTLPDGKNYSSHTLENINYCIGIQLNELSTQLEMKEPLSHYITTSYIPNYVPEYMTKNIMILSEVQKILNQTILDQLLTRCPTYHSGYEKTMIIGQNDSDLLSLLG